METKKMTGGEVFSLLLFFMPLMMLVQGFAISKLWNWFIAHTFTDIHIGIFQAVGLVLTYSAFFVSTNTKSDRKFGDYVETSVVVSLTCLILVFFGWIVHSI